MAASGMDTFETARLTAERLNNSHLADLTALHLDVEVSRYLGGVRSPEVTGAYLATNIAHWDRHGFGLWVLRTRDGAFAGRAGLRYVTVGGQDEVEIAYAFRREVWGLGLATEITAALVRIGFEDLALSSLVGVVVIAHTPSRHVLEKSGFMLEGEVDFHGARCVLYRRLPGDLSPLATTGL
jgi:RimJ/RimL family protein N-acetyltransferase